MGTSFWTFVTIVGVAGIIGSLLEKRMKYSRERGISGDALAAIEQRLDAMERRLENLESICIEHERSRKFDDALIRASVKEDR